MDTIRLVVEMQAKAESGKPFFFAVTQISTAHPKTSDQINRFLLLLPTLDQRHIIKRIQLRIYKEKANECAQIPADRRKMNGLNGEENNLL